MVTLGLWDNFLGTDFVQASTTMHEFGHNFERDAWRRLASSPTASRTT